jgi:hypothetical protein
MQGHSSRIARAFVLHLAGALGGSARAQPGEEVLLAQAAFGKAEVGRVQLDISSASTT